MRGILTVSVGTLLMASGMAMGQGTTFAGAEGVALGTNTRFTASGSVATDSAGMETLVATFADQELLAGTVDTYNLSITAGASFRAETSAGTSGGATVDTRMRARDGGGATIDDDDDSGPGLYSEVTGSVLGDGVLDLDISHFSDSGYDGSHSSTGFYDLNVWEVTGVVPGNTGQFWSFENLTPGGEFEAETFDNGGITDTVLAAFASDGTLIGSNDDGGAGFFSLLSGTVPADGIVVIAAAGYHGFSGQGDLAYYETGGDDDGTFGLTFIPAPSSLALLGLGGLVAGRRRR